MNTQPKKAKLQGKTASHRRSLVKSLMIELIRSERLQTTPKKARLLKQEFDRLVTEAKKDNMASKRRVMSKLGNEKAVEKLYTKLLPQLSDRNSGYLKSARTLPRKGDNADQMIVLISGSEAQERRSALSEALARRGDKSDKTPKKKASSKPVASKKEISKNSSVKATQTRNRTTSK